MALIVRRGNLPSTPHTEFHYFPGVLALEEIHGCFGFSGPWTRKLRVRRYITESTSAPRFAAFSLRPQIVERPLQPYLIHTDQQPYSGDCLNGRRCILVGPSTRISSIRASQSFPERLFFRNAEAHEIYFFQEGDGILSTEFGTLPLRKNAYVIVPKGTTYRMDLHTANAWAMLVESRYPIDWPPHYLNDAGQAHLTSPVVETEVELPTLEIPKDETGHFTIMIQHGGGLITESTLGHHPFDVCGWEGALYPFLFDIGKHHGIAREIHTAPPAHQTFQSGRVPENGFSLCSFVPQVEGWHPRDVGAPYAHLNVDSDEVMFFCNTSYGARKGIVQDGSITFHPAGVPHSPHGKAAERSTAHRGKMIERLAVMLDTYFEPLSITQEGLQLSDPSYPESWYKARIGSESPHPPPLAP